MSHMSEVHQDLESIHNILLGQRKVAQDQINKLTESHKTVLLSVVQGLESRIECINDLLLEFEAAGVVWPGNVVELNTAGVYCTRCANGNRAEVCGCGGDIHPEHGPNC